MLFKTTLGQCHMLKEGGYLQQHLLQETRDFEPMLAQCLFTVYDVGPTLNRNWLNVSCLLRSIS